MLPGPGPPGGSGLRCNQRYQGLRQVPKSDRRLQACGLLPKVLPDRSRAARRPRARSRREAPRQAGRHDLPLCPITAHYVNKEPDRTPGAPRCQRAPGIVTSLLPRVDRPLDVPPSPSFDPTTPPPPVWFPHSPGRPISGWRPFSLSCRASPPPMVLRRRREAQSLRKGHQWDQS